MKQYIICLYWVFDMLKTARHITALKTKFPSSDGLAQLGGHRNDRRFKAMATCTIHAAKTNRSRLLEQACAGEEVISARLVIRLDHATRPSPGSF
ncbi:MAG: hypothetical protein JNM60_02775 [Candidatus Competibacteraceae bacterium]|nr:hypothetical protein [Candidatus Competibacteraceae bacterium]